MANVRLPAATRSALADAYNTLINGGSGPGTIKVYTGTQPATGGGGLSGNTLLGMLTFSDPAASAASSGVLTFSTITSDTSADASGTATWARIADSNGTTVFDCDVSTSGATINLNSVTIVAGDTIAISSFTLTVGAS